MLIALAPIDNRSHHRVLAAARAAVLRVAHQGAPSFVVPELNADQWRGALPLVQQLFRSRTRTGAAEARSRPRCTSSTAAPVRRIAIDPEMRLKPCSNCRDMPRTPSSSRHAGDARAARDRSDPTRSRRSTVPPPRPTARCWRRSPPAGPACPNSRWRSRCWMHFVPRARRALGVGIRSGPNGRSPSRVLGPRARGGRRGRDRPRREGRGLPLGHDSDGAPRRAVGALPRGARDSRARRPAALAAATVGARCGDVDHAAREVITAPGSASGSCIAPVTGWACHCTKRRGSWRTIPTCSAPARCSASSPDLPPGRVRRPPRGVRRADRRRPRS